MQAWQRNIMESGLVEKTVSSDFETRFADFYLTNTGLLQKIGQRMTLPWSAVMTGKINDEP